jgi:hypothetical protein
MDDLVSEASVTSSPTKEAERPLATEALPNAPTQVAVQIPTRWEAPSPAAVAADSASKALVMAYLKYFGHAPDSVDGGEEDFSAALRNFQAFGHIPGTGKYDEATYALIARPRCGHQDTRQPSFVATEYK